MMLIDWFIADPKKPKPKPIKLTSLKFSASDWIWQVMRNERRIEREREREMVFCNVNSINLLLNVMKIALLSFN